jgi:hypothetical protein
VCVSNESACATTQLNVLVLQGNSWGRLREKRWETVTLKSVVPQQLSYGASTLLLGMLLGDMFCGAQSEADYYQSCW